MSLAIITGASGLVGSALSSHFHELGYDIWGIDNDTRKDLFGVAASTRSKRDELCQSLPRYQHFDVDIRDATAISKLVAAGAGSVSLIVHAAGQPSHDWAARDPHTDFTINANGTLNVLEAARTFAPNAPFVFLSTNKVYGDRPNSLPLKEQATRYELADDHPVYGGIDTGMGIDQTTHSLFGVSKTAADLMVQEFGRYFDMPTVTLRCGCITGPNHAGAELHGFLAYLMRCTAEQSRYTVYGYQGKQVRDNLHTDDLANAIALYVKAPRNAAVYNLGGGRDANCSVLEAIELCEKVTGKSLDWRYQDANRIGDHKWWISDLAPFRSDYPEWNVTRSVEWTLSDIYQSNGHQWR